MFNCILLSLSVLIMIFCIISVVAENINIRNKDIFTFFRNIRITIRSLDFTAFMTSSVIVVIIGLMFHDKNKDIMLLDILFLFISFIVIHSDKIFRLQKNRKHLRFRKLIPLKKKLPFCAESVLCNVAELCREAESAVPSEIVIKASEKKRKGKK